jgi:phosphoribosyl 1,2-cyclic phosphate phosphodiesterase
MPQAATITVLGSGTSMGVPMLGCSCATCTSKDPRDTRTRPALAVSWAEDHEEKVVVIDTGPEFRMQALREGIHKVDAVFYTHSHADHILGLDDLRPLSFRRKSGPLPLYADDITADVLERIFDYTFSPLSTYPNKARVVLHRLSGAEKVLLGNAVFQRVPIFHGRLFELLRDLDVVILDALRWEHHPSHANVDEAVAWVDRLGARRAFFTHMSHELAHAATEARLPAHIRLLHDGLRIGIEL